VQLLTENNFRQAAIVQGAALRGLEGLFARSRRCRRYYGYTSGKTFREGVDDPHTAYFDLFYGDKCSSGHMAWLTRKVFPCPQRDVSGVLIRINSRASNFLLIIVR
jgi:hypothetical protein